jgi:excisionase family DNA binding protein
MHNKAITTEKVRRKLSILEAAQRVGVTDRTIRNWIAQGLLPAYKYGNKIVRINPDDLDNLGHRIPSGGGL